MHTNWSSLSLRFFSFLWFWLTFNKNPPIQYLTKLEYGNMPISKSTQNPCKGFLSLQNGFSVWFTSLHNHGEDCWSDSCLEDDH